MGDAPVRIVLAEDNVFTLRSLTEDVDWTRVPAVVVGAAATGDEALDMVTRLDPDVLVSDIRLPGMTGLDLAARLRDQGLPTAVVLITAYSELDYALDAIRNAVVAFIAKPVDTDELIDAVVRAGAAAARNRVSGSAQIVRSAVLDTEEDLVSALFGVDFSESEHREPSVVVGAVRLPGAELSAVSILRALLSGCSYRILQYADSESVALVSSPVGGGDGLRDSLSSDLRSRNHAGEVAICVLSPPPVRPPTALVALLRSCYSELDRMRFYGIRGVRSVSPASSEASGDGEGSTAYPEEAGSELERALRAGGSRAVEAALAELRHQCRVSETPPGVLHAGLRRSLSALAVELDRQELLDWANELDSVSTHTALFLLLDDLVSRHRSTQRIGSAQVPSRIAHALEYIHAHYDDPDLSLAEVAGAAGYSPAHLSTLFTTIYSRSFHETLTDERIRAASRLLRSTDLLIYEVADRVGFRNAFHFSTRFKSETGLTPSQYRKQATKE